MTGSGGPLFTSEPQSSVTDPRLDPGAILFGADPLERVVAIESNGDAGIRIYRRRPEGVTVDVRPFEPWILTTTQPAGGLSGATWTRLEGEGLCWLAAFQTTTAYRSALFQLRDQHAELLTYGALPKLAMTRLGITPFKGMAFDELVRMQVDIETTGLNAETDRLLLVAVTDSLGLQEVLSGTEGEMLEALTSLVTSRDPDVIEGHNVFGFDLPFLLTRANALDIPIGWGRDGSPPVIGRPRNTAIGGNTRPFTPISIFGRSVIDTLLVVQRYDWARGELSGYGLKECARTFGIAHEDRIELPRDQMERLYAEDPARVRKYALQDAVETARLAELISPVDFYQTQMSPDNYQQVALAGAGEKINALMVRAYLRAGAAVPLAQPSRAYAGAYTEVRHVGLFEHVVKADVESLYPSLMLTHSIAPRSDRLGVFLPALKSLTERRLSAKRQASEAEHRGDSADARYWDGVQGSFKVLINSFYGYLGAPMNFNDMGAAERVTALGREVALSICRRFEELGATVIEVDTDGVYVSPPPGTEGEEAERRIVETVGSVLPTGIRLAFDGRYRAMLSLKIKNYVLETYDGRRILKGAALRSRADEPFGRDFLAGAIDCLLRRDVEGVGSLYQAAARRILDHQMTIAQLARRERVTGKTFSSSLKRREAEAAKGLKTGDFMMVYQRADGDLARAEQFNRDEDTAYYLEKLYRFAARLEPVIGEDFRRIIPPLRRKGEADERQGELDLF
ncbi:MAG: DNA polymerase [Armatimonadetes bacterium]|nr:DNA polymerase [Armatimonadota bacterium]MDE2205178.1 DNA polymerase [Armatimonadota bacterium]